MKPYRRYPPTGPSLSCLAVLVITVAWLSFLAWVVGKVVG